MSDSQKVLVTKKGYQKLVEELDHLQNVARKEVAARLKEAISYGDLSENAEYDEAKNQQAFIEGRILELEDQIKNAEIIEESGKKNVVRIGSKVKLKFENGDEKEFTIVGPTESDPMSKKISNESPVGAAILGKKKKEKVKIAAPIGEYFCEILEIL